ncbi:MAG: NAD-glutamate dehydrogenase domain-containing protein, partial [Rhodanobacteraceae bacterium]
MNDTRASTGADLAAVLDEVRTKFPASLAPLAQSFVTACCAELAPEELSERSAQTWATLFAELFALVQTRQPGEAKVRVFNPDRGDGGRDGICTTIEIVTDDMPFLVDTVGMAVNDARLQMHRLIHPVLAAARDARGELQAFGEGLGAKWESVMHAEIDRVGDAELPELQTAIEDAFDDVRAAVADWRPMRDKMLEVADALPQRRMPFNTAEVAEAQAFLRWAADDHFTFLGYREYAVVATGDDELLRAKPDSGLGILRSMDLAVAPRSLKSLAATKLPQSGSVDAIILTKTNARSRVHRPGYMDYIGVLCFDEHGKPVGEQRFLGLFTSTAYMRRPQDVPLLRQKFATAVARSGFRPHSHSGKAFRSILEMLPRDELLQCSADELFALTQGIFELKERAHTRLFVRRDAYGRFFSCLVFIPRDHFNTSVRERVEAMLRETLHGQHVDSTIQIGDSPLARLHIVVRPRPGDQPKIDVQALQAQLEKIVRNWHDELRDALTQRVGEERGARLTARYGRALSAGYIEEVTPSRAAADVETLSQLSDGDDIHLLLYRPHNQPDTLHFKIFRSGPDIALSEVLPLLENAGLKVLSEQVYTLDIKGASLCIQDFVVQPAAAMVFDVEALHEHFESAFEAIWRGRAENDGFNKLLLNARLAWRQIAVLRAYCKYQQQVGTTFSQAYMEETLNRYPAIAGLLVELFDAKFDPQREQLAADRLAHDQKALREEMAALVPASSLETRPELIDEMLAVLSQSRENQVQMFIDSIKALLENVSSLDDDRILRGFMGLIRATLRSNYFQMHAGEPAEYLSLKFDSAQVPDMPKPVPYREIWVYAPRVEGVHLRFGPVARGGLRWSDRREDFRTEVLGLVKAQMVKNTVIVPVGSKGGFFVKKPPLKGDRDAQLAEGIACYKLFINGLLDITDNIDTAANKVLHPADVVRHDADDPYLVVAADKGTATFSDIANGVSAEHHYWLGDAFASGGSAGYDHKEMGITAKGTWESVVRHFRALSRDCQTQDFTCVGIGDMSGDVFGNGMLLSKHTRLLAAFDHRHIFLDPNPDAASSFVGRERMFKLPRSSWEDYDKSKISAGGGVYARTLKSIPVSRETRAALSISGEVEALPPNELMRAILKAPVDLLWNGGIGTYVKATAETSTDVGDRANNALRIDGHELRCKIVGEGGNLGLTQKGRIEAAQHGVLLNTDFIDNSAGVDTSDHEVNIKILLNDPMRRGELTLEGRNTLLASMTDEVEQLVLADNYRQNVALSLMEHMSVHRLGSKAHFIRVLEAEGKLDRQIESLPSDAEI